MRTFVLKISAIIFISLCFFKTPVFSKTSDLLPTSLPISDTAALNKNIRVAVLLDAPVVLISIDQPYEISPKNPLLSGTKVFDAVIKPHKEGLMIDDGLYRADHMTFKVKSGSIRINKREYLHQIQIFKNSKGNLNVINQINLEEYLKGVLPLEVHAGWPIEALKAHAVVSRTFALFKAIEKKDEAFSLLSTVRSQVYGGSLFHKTKTDEAIDSTSGEVLTFKDKIFPSYFHAACGGHTAQADKIWSVEPNPVLKGVVCNFCSNSKYWKWSFYISLKQIEATMQKNGYPAKHLNNIILTNYDPSGRASKVILRYQYSDLTIGADELRTYLGYERLKSLKATVVVKNGKAYFSGFGWGHGIGLCQWGARKQAAIGKTYRQIVAFYFPGSEIKKI